VISDHTLQTAMDNLAVGLDPEKVTIFTESSVPEIYELAAFFSMYVTHNEALRNPTIKDEIKMKGMGDLFSLGFINYPIYQAADILCLKAEVVPVGIDQEAHLEQSREIARSMNAAAGVTIFPEPKAVIGRVGKLVGTDGNPKMSKSIGNTIFLSETEEEVKRKVLGMYTDPNRIHKTDPGVVEGNPVFDYLDTFGTEDDRVAIEDFKLRYQEGGIGDVEIKTYLAGVINRFLEPIRERRRMYEENPQLVKNILKRGGERVRLESQKTLVELKSAFTFIS
jgi:tryptophanyl-tRNA synthetase